MYRRYFRDLEEQILNSVDRALDSSTFHDIKHTFKGYKNKFNDRCNKENEYTNDNSSSEPEDVKISAYICSKIPGNVASILYLTFGWILFTLFFLSILSIGVLFFILQMKFFWWLVAGMSLSIIFSLVGMILIGSGLKTRNRIKRFKKYVEILQSHEYCTIKQFSESVNKKEKFIVKDVRDMIRLEMFPEGHISEDETYFMLNDSAYDEYINLQNNLEKEKEERIKREEQEKAEMADPQKKQLRLVVETGEKYIKEISDINSFIKNEKVNEKLNKLQNIIRRILECIKENPEKVNEVDKFINYYLPTTLKLLNEYKSLDAEDVQSDNIVKTKEEIENMLDVINDSFLKLFDNLFEDVAMDVSTDISVMYTLLKQEGLTKGDFEK
ncbi:5-bromo-4-chloroindolyl phosphate hydrolysis family protein [Clostridium sp. BJN0001]|uniref:5-bromo-4-chloroindolyl phosphate hydrolysis family protein n=1 Tax=Clostridium sp. BJN0001 TaxID=2930219 RepID=UPI001FD01587|nr:5-bromo-4-chloroindolyl phosphate hydrolysis family protein [Clostridium sp. BJN0001]